MWWKYYLEIYSLVIVVLFLIFYEYVSYHYKYWTRRNVSQVEVRKFFGNLKPIVMMEMASADVIKNIYEHPSVTDKEFVGIYIFHKPAILLREPELIKRVLIRDFAKFSNRFLRSDVRSDPMGSKSIFVLRSPLWRDVRMKLTPFFTSARLKKMFYLIDEVGCNFNEWLLKLPTDENNAMELDVKEFCAQFTTDVIATVAFGVTANSFEYPNGDFRRNGREIFRFSFMRSLHFLFAFFLPQLVSLLGVVLVPKEQNQFLRNVFNDVVEEREKSGKQRNDLIDILIEMKNSSKITNPTDDGKVVFDKELLLAQAAVFFSAGFESSSSTMSFALYEMAKHPDIQQRVREEIRSVLLANHNNKQNVNKDAEDERAERAGLITMQIIDELEYMQMVIDETLRLYPPLPFLDRDTELSKGETYSLQPYHNFAIPNGMPVYVPIYALHMDAKYFPNPKEFQPERFSAANKKTIHPCTYMPFGEGPRGCIGPRLAMLQTKIGLLHLLCNHRVAVCDKTVLDMKLNPKALILQSQGGIHLKIIRDPLFAK